MRNKIQALYNKQFRGGLEKAILEMLEYNPKATYLDLGCQEGIFTKKMASKIGTGNIQGIDLVEGNATGIIKVASDLEEPLPFPDGILNVITASHIIEHLSNTDNFIKETYRTLVPGGYAIVSTPNLSSFHIIAMLLLNKQPTTCSISDKMVEAWMDIGPRHRRLFTMEGLVSLLTYYKFTVERKIYSGYFPLPDWISKIVFYGGVHSNCITVKARKPNE